MHNEKHSYRDYTQRDLRGENALDWSGEVVGTCFQQDHPRTPVFPPDATCTFIRCNLNNCQIPDGCKVVDGCNHQHTEQNDGEQWIIDKQNRPTAPLNVKAFRRYALSEDPKDIPNAPRKPVTERAAVARYKRRRILELRQQADALEVEER